MEDNISSQDLKSKLLSILDKYDEYLKQRREEKENNEGRKYTESFLKIRDEIIRPVFEKIKAEIEARGHKVRIEVKELSWNSKKNIPIEPSISFNLELMTVEIRQNHFHGIHKIPCLSFIYNSLEKKVYMHKLTIGPGQIGYAESKKEFKLNQISNEVVEKELFNWVKKLMSNIAPSYF